MNPLATLRIAVRALRRNTLRTLLTMLGIIIGVGAVIAMVSIGNGAKAQMEARVASLGQNVIQVFSGAMSRGGFRGGFGSTGTLTREDYEAIRREISGVNGASPEVRSFTQLAAGNQNVNSQMLGVGADYVDIRAWPIAQGANFTENDVRNANKVALIGQTTATTLFADVDPVGQVVRVKTAPFTIVGLLAPKGTAMFGQDQDDVLLVPYTSAMRRLSGETTFRSFMVQAADKETIPAVQQQITELLRQRHKIVDGRDDDFIVRTQQEIADFATESSRIMTYLLAAVASVSLLVGGIGIMNIMLVSVTERTREIGLRMAVGARGRDILLQFLIEAVTLSVVGGLIGILLGTGGAQLVSSKLGWDTLVSVESIVVAFVFSAFIGVFFGFYPARKAARLDPIDALRYE
ncbi:MAG TPA: ABC transporter permease [Candidatus Saccharimonadales bacterium]|jgi:putative ABC transport system permease protein|nr:ABC transporter permease [Candidatus Saccharimonadales bacterium]